MMRLRTALPIAGLALTLALSGATAQDGTGGPEFETPSPELCDRDLISADAFAEFEQPTGEFFSGSMTPVNLAEIEARDPVDTETALAIDEMLRAYGACVVRDGAIGAYAFLDPGLELIELIYLGISGATLGGDGMIDGEDPFAQITPATNFTPRLVVQLDEGRIGALIAAPQPGTELALLTLVNIDGVWFIEGVAPVLPEGAGDQNQGGGP